MTVVTFTKPTGQQTTAAVPSAIKRTSTSSMAARVAKLGDRQRIALEFMLAGAVLACGWRPTGWNRKAGFVGNVGVISADSFLGPGVGGCRETGDLLLASTERSDHPSAHPFDPVQLGERIPIPLD